MQDYQKEIIATALDKMLNRQNHFSICTVDKISEAIGSNCSSHPDYKFLNALHCVNYSEMSEELKSKLPELIMSVLTARFDTGLMVKAMDAVLSGEVKDLPNTEDDLPTRLLN